MNVKSLKKVLESYTPTTCCCCPVSKGLDVIRKYVPVAGVSYANNTLYSVRAQSLIDSGITHKDIEILGEAGWKVAKNSGSMVWVN